MTRLFHTCNMRNDVRHLAFVLSILSMLALALLDGCSSSLPRFHSGTKKSAAEPKESIPATRFSSKEVEEETKENDKIVGKDEAERVLSGARDFRRERNESFTPLQQSKMMREISKYMGVRYELGGENQQGLDCSAYTMLVYKNSLGKLLPRSSDAQWDTGLSVELEDLKFGDLIFFNTTGESASHVGIYLGDDLFAHASVTLGVTISSLQSSYYKNRYEGARRIVQ